MCNKNSLCVCHACCFALQLKVQRFIQAARLRMRLLLSAQGVDSDTVSQSKREWEHSGFIFGKGVDASSKICSRAGHKSFL